MRYNMSTSEVGVQGSKMEVPSWAGRVRESLPASSGTIVDQASALSEDSTRVRGLSTSQKSSDFKPSNLMSSQIFNAPITVDYPTISDWALEHIPVDEPDCTDWMVPAEAHTIMTEARANEYGRAGGLLNVAADSAYQPGVSTGPLSFKSAKGSDVEEAGEADLIFEDGTETSMPVPGDSKLITGNSLNWALGSNFQEDSWIGTMYSIGSLANNPSKPIGFMTFENHTAPLMIGHKPSRPSVLNRVSMTLETNEAQTVNFSMRSVMDYTREIVSFSQDIPKGKSTTTFRMLALSMLPMIMIIDPKDGSKVVLNDYSVFP